MHIVITKHEKRVKTKGMEMMFWLIIIVICMICCFLTPRKQKRIGWDRVDKTIFFISFFSPIIPLTRIFLAAIFKTGTPHPLWFILAILSLVLMILGPIIIRIKRAYILSECISNIYVGMSINEARIKIPRNSSVEVKEDGSIIFYLSGENPKYKGQSYPEGLYFKCRDDVVTFVSWVK